MADRGHEVSVCAASGWRPNKTAVEEMAAKVEEALKELSPRPTYSTTSPIWRDRNREATFPFASLSTENFMWREILSGMLRGGLEGEAVVSCPRFRRKPVQES